MRRRRASACWKPDRFLGRPNSTRRAFARARGSSRRPRPKCVIEMPRSQKERRSRRAERVCRIILVEDAVFANAQTIIALARRWRRSSTLDGGQAEQPRGRPINRGGKISEEPGVRLNRSQPESRPAFTDSKTALPESCQLGFKSARAVEGRAGPRARRKNNRRRRGADLMRAALYPHAQRVN